MADTQQIMDMAEKLGLELSKHPAVDRFKQAQKTLAEDPGASKLVNDFNRQLVTLARQEESGMPVSDAQRMQLETLQSQLAGHLKVKAMNIAQVEFVDLLRRVNDTIRKHLAEAEQPDAPAPGPKLAL
jgi:cell fate (sporulation/competence/biofilm development) regulator YlbF (YheA/YmcA/DUF963 family)